MLDHIILTVSVRRGYSDPAGVVTRMRRRTNTKRHDAAKFERGAAASTVRRFGSRHPPSGSQRDGAMRVASTRRYRRPFSSAGPLHLLWRGDPIDQRAHE